MHESRLNSSIKRKAIHNVLLVLFGFILIIIILVIFGTRILIGFSLFVGKLHGSNWNASTIAQQANTYVAPPIVNPIPDATNKNQIDISGTAQKNETISLYVNNQLVDKTSTGSNNQFQFSSVALQSGQNTIKTQAESNNNKLSSFSNTFTITYLKGPPSLTITQPQDGQTFTIGNSPSISIQGQTDPGVKITVNGFWAIVDSQGKYNYLYTLKNGDNDIKVVATDAAGNQATKEIHVHAQ